MVYVVFLFQVRLCRSDVFTNQYRLDPGKATSRGLCEEEKNQAALEDAHIHCNLLLLDTTTLVFMLVPFKYLSI